MNDVQMQMMSLARHQRILERVRAEEAAAAKPAASFAAALKGGPAVEPIAAALAPAAPSPAMTAMEPAAEPQRTLTTRAPAQAAVPQLSADQAALLAASLGASLPDESVAPAAAVAPTAATAATPDMSDDQMAALMAAFGHETAPAEIAARQMVTPDQQMPQTAAAMAATAIPQMQGDNLRYFPINRDAQAEAAAGEARQMAASDTYLRAMQQMERNLGAYGGLTANGR